MAKILLVDDAAFMRKVIKDTLSKNGYSDLHEAVDGADAVEKFKELKGCQIDNGVARIHQFLCNAVGQKGFSGTDLSQQKQVLKAGIKGFNK